MGAKPAKERPGVGVLLSEKELAQADENYDDEMIVTPPGKINIAWHPRRAFPPRITISNLI